MFFCTGPYKQISFREFRPHMTKLERLQNIGIRRLGGPKRGFRYQSQNGRLTKADLDRIQKLRIPPAWGRRNQSGSEGTRAGGRARCGGRWQYPLSRRSHPHSGVAQVQANNEIRIGAAEDARDGETSF
jgi:hypothetical protein